MCDSIPIGMNPNKNHPSHSIAIDQKMSEIDTITTENGAEITVCQEHQWELCYKCCMDFTEMNQEAISDANKKKAASKHEMGDSLDPGQLRVGTEVRMPDRSGRKPPTPLDGKIVGVMEETDQDSDYCGDTCYVIKLVNNEMMTYPVDWVHDEWLVKLDGKYIPTSKVLALFSQ
ncbi:hypothetical protein KEM48_003484 [Puccinia striiformis f. sp. tritici PST-130]|nr:hypothetical protein KEM48_003484 [Puccinia striiformis f. sp. tritici PST-130]